MGRLRREAVLVMRREPIDRDIAGGGAAQAGVDDLAGLFEERHEAVEARAQIGLVQRLQRVAEEVAGLGVDPGIEPGGAAARLAAGIEIGATLMGRIVHEAEITADRLVIPGALRHDAAGAAEQRARDRIAARPRDIGE